MVYADANIIIRYIVNDDEDMAAKAETAINGGFMFVLPEVFAEVVYVLTKVYGIDRKDVADSMLELLVFVSTAEPEVMKAAFSYYKETHLDFVDCILASHCIVGGKEHRLHSRHLPPPGRCRIPLHTIVLTSLVITGYNVKPTGAEEECSTIA